MRAFYISLASVFAVVAIIFSLITFVAYPLKYKDHIKAAGQTFNVDSVLIASIIKVESRFKTNAISAKGAIGLMQILPSTADFIAIKLDIAEYNLADPETNIKMGTYYLRYLLDKFTDTKTAIMAYNAGEGRVRSWLNGAEKLETTPFPETNAYVENVLNASSYYRFRL